MRREKKAVNWPFFSQNMQMTVLTSPMASQIFLLQTIAAQVERYHKVSSTGDTANEKGLMIDIDQYHAVMVNGFTYLAIRVHRDIFVRQ